MKSEMKNIITSLNCYLNRNHKIEWKNRVTDTKNYMSQYSTIIQKLKLSVAKPYFSWSENCNKMHCKCESFNLADSNDLKIIKYMKQSIVINSCKKCFII